MENVYFTSTPVKKIRFRGDVNQPNQTECDPLLVNDIFEDLHSKEAPKPAEPCKEKGLLLISTSVFLFVLITF